MHVINGLRKTGRFRPFQGAVVISYILAFLFTAGAMAIAPAVVKEFLTSGNIKPGLAGVAVQLAGPAFAGGIGALIPLWLSAGPKTK